MCRRPSVLNNRSVCLHQPWVPFLHPGGTQRGAGRPPPRDQDPLALRHRRARGSVQEGRNRRPQREDQGRPFLHPVLICTSFGFMGQKSTQWSTGWFFVPFSYQPLFRRRWISQLWPVKANVELSSLDCPEFREKAVCRKKPGSKRLRLVWLWWAVPTTNSE